MNKRKIQKEKTRKHILNVAKKNFINRGFLKTTTSAIASDSGIAHGTLFLHFKNKDTLIIEILDQQLEQISFKIMELIRDTRDLEIILERYLEFIQQEEDFFCVLARELPFYQEQLRRKILFRESLIRSKFVKAIETGIGSGLYKNCDSRMTNNFFFSTINYYLSLKPIFVTDGSVIEKFKKRIISTYITMLLREESNE